MGIALAKKNDLAVEDVRWFGGVGIVKVKFDGVIQYFIRSIDGFDPEVDKACVAAWGHRFPKEAGDQLFKS